MAIGSENFKDLNHFSEAEKKNESDIKVNIITEDILDWLIKEAERDFR